MTLGEWEVDAQGEVVGVGPSEEEVGLGEVCPASWTCLVKTREVERDTVRSLKQQKALQTIQD